MSATMTKTRPQTITTAGRHPLSALRQELDEMVARFWDGVPERGWLTGAFTPAMDLKEAENAFEVRVDLPGMESKDIEVQVEGNTLTISGTRAEEKEEKGETFHRVERRHGGFSRTLTLPCRVNEGEVAAEYEKGVLTVKLPKCEETQGKKVSVKG